jgi:hypothetical protein
MASVLPIVRTAASVCRRFLGSARASHYLPLSTELACRTQSAIGDSGIILIARADMALDVMNA